MNVSIVKLELHPHLWHKHANYKVNVICNLANSKFWWNFDWMSVVKGDVQYLGLLQFQGFIEHMGSMIKEILKQLSSINHLIIPFSFKELAQTLVC